MSIFETLFGCDFSKGSRLVDASELRSLYRNSLGDIGTELLFTPSDSQRTLLTPENLRKLISRYVCIMAPYREERFDCDDFSFVAYGQILKGANESGLKRTPAIGVAFITRKSGSRHALLICLDSRGTAWLYEPQDNRWDCRFADVESVDQVIG